MGKLGSEQLGTDQLGSIVDITGTAAAETQAYSKRAYAYATGSGEITGTTPAVDLGEQWRVIRDNDTEESDLFDVEVVDTANPFGNYAIAYLDDTSGQKFDNYDRGTRVDFEVSVDGGLTFTRRFSGYVVEAREQDQQGADTLEVEAYSFDQFLRRNTVSEDQTGRTISEALENIVRNDTPVAWDATNVDVVDDKELTRSYRGELVENVLRSLASTSANEAFGVNTDVEFFFSPGEVENAPRDIDNSQWFDYDIPEQGKETVNQVTVFYDSGNQSVTVDNGSDKTQLQGSLDTQDPVTIGQEVSRPDITNFSDAQAVGEKILNDRASTLTGTVTTYGLTDAQPGDVISITINERGIDDDFRIAQIEYLWGRGETRLTIVRKKGDQDEVLVRLSDSLQRIETQDANRDGTSNRITSTNVGVILPVSGSVDTVDFTTAKVTNNLRNQLRDTWGEETNVSVAEIAVGNDSSTPTRSDTALGNELARASVTESLPTAQSVSYEASLSESDVREVGLFDSSGNLLVRAIIPDSSLSSPVDVDLSIDVQDDPETDPICQVTNTGQTAVRDVIADNNPSKPTDYAYGSDDTEPTETDISLGNQVVTAPLDEVLAQSADTDTEWNNILSIGANTPAYVAGGELRHAQVAFVQEAEDTNLNTDTQVATDSAFSDTEAAQMASTTSGFSGSFTVNYTMPSDEVEIYIRKQATTTSNPGYDFLVDGTVEFSGLAGFESSTALEWFQLTNGVSNDLTPGSHTFEFDVTDAGDAYNVDVVAITDGRFTYTFDNTVDANNALSGPELYTTLTEQTFATATAEQNFDAARLNQTWNNTENDQYIAVSNDGGSNFERADNAQTLDASFNQSNNEAITKVGLSRFDDGRTTTPTSGNSGQAIDLHELFAEVNTIRPSDIGIADVQGIVGANTIDGETLREAGELDTNANLLTRCTFAEFEVAQDERVISSEAFSWDNA